MIRKSLQFIQVDAFEIHIGEQDNKFTILKNQLSGISKYFLDAKKRGDSLIIIDVNEEIFGIFLTWSLVSDIERAVNYVEISTGANGQSEYEKQWFQLAQCWILGAQLDSPGFQNAAMDLLIVNSKQFHSKFDKVAGTTAKDIGLVFGKTSSRSLLRKLILDNVITLSSLDATTVYDGSEAFIFEYFKDFSSLTLKMLRDDTAPRTPWAADVCAYHVHGPLAPRCFCEASTKN